MKRSLESPIESGVEFFALEESVELLCASLPSLTLLINFLRLSKIMRYRVWIFLSDPVKCSSDWCELLCSEIFSYHKIGWVGKNRPMYYNMHPVFILGRENLIKEKYYLGRLIINDEGNNDDNDDAVLAVFNPTLGVKSKYFLSWDIYRDIPRSDMIEWYLVASALALRADKIICKDSQFRWHPEKMLVPSDDFLFISPPYSGSCKQQKK
jgi:hypothetical protein